MSLHRVRQRLARMLAEHEEGERDGHAPTAQAHATLAAQLREDIAAIDEARAEVELLTDHAAGTLCIRCDLLQVERDEARDALRLSVSAWEAAGMQGRSAHDAILALQRRAEQAEAALGIERAALTAHAVESEREHDEGIHSCHDRCSRPACVMRRERDEARAQLAALRDAASAVTLAGVTLAEIVHAEEWDALDAVITDTTAAAESYTSRVRAEALREAADDSDRDDSSRARWLRARADEIERGR